MKAELRRFPILKGLEDEQLENLSQVLKPQKLKTGDVLFQEGENGTSLFFLMKGTVSIRQNLTLLDEEMNKTQASKSLITLKSSHNPFFGEMALLGQGVRTATVQAVEDCQLMELAQKDFSLFIKESPLCAARMLANIGTLLSERLTKANRDILKLTTALSIALG